MLTDAQLANRQTGIGGSDAGIVAGVSDRMTALELYFLKRGEFEPEPEGNDDTLAWLGNAIEPVTDKWYERETGRRTRRCNRTLRHREADYMLAHPDRLVIGERRGCEYKMRVHPDGWGPHRSDEIPDDVMCQVQHYMGVTSRPVWDVVVLIAGREFRLYEIGRDDAFIDTMMSEQMEFWLRVETGTPPEIDYSHPTAPGLMQLIYDGTDGTQIELDEDALHWAEVWESARQHIALYEKTKSCARAHLDVVMGMAAIALLPDGSSLRRKKINRGAGYFDLQRSNAPRIST